MISVIIPSYNSENIIEKCLDSLTKQSYRGEYEIILVDSSEDNTPHIVVSNYPQIQVIRFDQKTDPGTARNAGIGKAKGELIAFIDSDCIATRDWLEKIAKVHAESSYRVVGGVVSNGNPEHDLVGWAGYFAEFREFLPEISKQEVMHIPTCNISYKKEVFLEFGTFQGRYYPQEDLVYNYNLRQNGEKILLDPQIQVQHVHRSQMRDFLHHQKKIGTITARVLKFLQLKGSFFARHPLMAVLFSPLLLAVKFIRTVSVFLRYRPDIIRKHPLILILLLLGMIYWALGFIKGTNMKDPI